MRAESERVPNRHDVHPTPCRRIVAKASAPATPPTAGAFDRSLRTSKPLTFALVALAGMRLVACATDDRPGVAAAAQPSAASEPAAAHEEPPPPPPWAGAALPQSGAGAVLLALASTPPAVVDGCPLEMTRLGRYCVDRWEAHLAVMHEDGRLEPHAGNIRPEEGLRYEARSEPAVYPQAYISRVESEAACKNAGKRLCTFPEWRRACQGKRWQRYPYGGSARRGVCNSGKEHLLAKFFGRDVRRMEYEKHFNDPRLDIEPGFLGKAGEHERCVSDGGAYDMVGNLHEWVSGTVTEQFVESLERDDVERLKQPWTEGNGMFLGGFFSTTDQHGPGCLYVTFAHEPRYHDYSTGFRCCRDAIVETAVKTAAAAHEKAPRKGARPAASTTSSAARP